MNRAEAFSLMGEYTQNPSLIKTVRGSGYIFTPAVEFS